MVSVEAPEARSHPAPSPRCDHFGHGTHIAGIIAGRQNADGGFRGMAPGAHLVSLKVMDAEGAGYTSDVIEAIDWAIANKGRFQLRVVNISLGHPITSPWRDDPLVQAVERATAAGLVVVTSAGNYGKAPDGTPIVAAWSRRATRRRRSRWARATPRARRRAATT